MAIPKKERGGCVHLYIFRDGTRFSYLNKNFEVKPIFFFFF